MLQMFHLDVVKADQGVARPGRCLSLLLGCSRGSTHVGFPTQGAGPCNGRGRGCSGGMRDVGQDVDTRAAQVSKPCPDAMSGSDVRPLGVPF